MMSVSDAVTISAGQVASDESMASQDLSMSKVAILSLFQIPRSRVDLNSKHCMDAMTCDMVVTLSPPTFAKEGRATAR